jgi:hypothetical protein
MPDLELCEERRAISGGDMMTLLGLGAKVTHPTAVYLPTPSVAIVVPKPPWSRHFLKHLLIRTSHVQTSALASRVCISGPASLLLLHQTHFTDAEALISPITLTLAQSNRRTRPCRPAIARTRPSGENALTSHARSWVSIFAPGCPPIELSARARDEKSAVVDARPDT